METHHVMVAVEEERTPHLEKLAGQIDRYEKTLAVLEEILRPVLARSGTVSAEPREFVADHQLHEQVNRIENANQALEAIINQIAL